MKKNSQKTWKKIIGNLGSLYTTKETDLVTKELKELVSGFRKRRLFEGEDFRSRNKVAFSDLALIVYANSIKNKAGKKPPLKSLLDFLVRYRINQAINVVHILPFYPWDTDRGFSVMDYYKVHPDYGSWQEIAELSRVAKLMFDFVANHVSVENPLVQAALISRHLKTSDSRYSKVAPYKDFVIAYPSEKKPSEDRLKSLARPRPTPVLTKYSVLEVENQKLKVILGDPPKKSGSGLLGQGWVWTTFSRPKNPNGSEDTRQVDLNFKNPRVLIEAIKVILFYVEKGALLIRLDAIGYIWKKLGSTSLHEKECHLILEIIKDTLFLAVPDIVAIAEVNELQDKVFEYLGKKSHEESDLIYQFAHFPLAIYSVLTEDGRDYMKWLETLKGIDGKQFITVLGSHDGLGLKPVRGILPESEIERLTDILVKKHKALPNYASLSGGKKIVYEICATPWNLINPPDSRDSFELQLSRYLAVLALGLMVRGLPAVYINGLIAAPNYQPKGGLDENRTINREIFNEIWLYQQLDSSRFEMGRAFKRIMSLLMKRSQEKSFAPSGPPAKLVYTGKKALISQVLESPDRSEAILGIVNVSKKHHNLEINLKEVGLKCQSLTDIVSGKKYEVEKGKVFLKVRSYQAFWLKTQLA